MRFVFPKQTVELEVQRSTFRELHVRRVIFLDDELATGRELAVYYYNLK